jgi:lysophospholipase L1-like esterase
MSSIYLFAKVIDYKGRLWIYKLATHPVYEGTQLPAFPSQTVLWMIGDSRAEAWNKSHDFPCDVWFNCGVSGLTSGEVLTKLKGDLSKSEAPRFAVIQCGINDIQASGYEPSMLEMVKIQVVANLQSMVKMLLDRNVSVVITTIIPKGDNSLRDHFLWTAEMHAAVMEINKKIIEMRQQVAVLDAANLVSSCGRTKKEYSKDGLHLNEIGYSILATELAEKIITK